MVGIVLWMIGGSMLCMTCYKAPGRDKGKESVKEWGYALRKAMAKATLVETICGVTVGCFTYLLFVSVPESWHKVIKPESLGMLFGFVPVTKAEVCVPFLTFFIGAIIALAMVFFVLPRLDNTGVLIVKPFRTIVVAVLIEAAVVTVPVLEISVGVFSKLTHGRRRPF